MSKWTVEFDGGGHIEVDAASEYMARRVALSQCHAYATAVVEVRPFAAKPRRPRVDEMPAITVRPDPFEILASLRKP